MERYKGDDNCDEWNLGDENEDRGDDDGEEEILGNENEEREVMMRVRKKFLVTILCSFIATLVRFEQVAFLVSSTFGFVECLFIDWY